MSEGSEGQKLSRIEQGSTPKYKQDIVQYKDGYSALCITGEEGAKFDFLTPTKYNPTRGRNEAIVATESGNDYYIAHDVMGGTYIVNTKDTVEKGKLVAVYTEEHPAPLPPLEFGKPWEYGSGGRTANVKELLLKYKVGPPGQLGRQLEAPDPFKKYKMLLMKYRPNEVF